jgi:hypothetical protein
MALCTHRLHRRAAGEGDQPKQARRPVTAEVKEILLVALHAWGALDENYTYRAGSSASDRRGYLVDAGSFADCKGRC